MDRTIDTLQISEGDRLARLAVINRLGSQLTEMEASWKNQVKQLHELLAASDADRTARLQTVHQLQRQLTSLEQQFALCDADRTARLEMINELSRTLAAADEDRNARLRIILQQEKMLQDQRATIAGQQRALQFLQASGVFHSLHRRCGNAWRRKWRKSYCRQGCDKRSVRAYALRRLAHVEPHCQSGNKGSGSSCSLAAKHRVY